MPTAAQTSRLPFLNNPPIILPPPAAEPAGVSPITRRLASLVGLRTPHFLTEASRNMTAMTERIRAAVDQLPPAEAAGIICAVRSLSTGYAARP